VIAGLAQGPFFGIGAVVAMKPVADKLAPATYIWGLRL
jgi:hypothetical protein